MWKDIKGYEGLYQVSTDGEVRSLDRYEKSKGNSTRLRKGKIRTLSVDKDGYKKIGLWKDSKVKHFKVHRLVAETFIENPHNYPVVNHIDGNKENNSIENLEWCTVRDNNIHSIEVLGHKTWISGAEASKIKTTILNTETGEILEFNSRKECEEYFGVEFNSIVGKRQCKRFKHLRLVGDANANDKFED